MITHVIGYLDKKSLQRARDWLKTTSWVEGSSLAKEVKNNLQANDSSEEMKIVSTSILSGIRTNKDVMMSTFPVKASMPLYTRYIKGMSHGPHVDNALMNDLRLDLAMTVFLSSPDEYKGGELMIEDTFGVQRIKLPQGYAVIYPATSVHGVATVEEGTRDVAVFWIQSGIRDHGRRRILWDLHRCKQKLEERMTPQPILTDIGSIYQNILRQWVEL
jgi:PKHD-type hydroxylase